MTPTELLIIGYDGDEVLFATSVTPDSAGVVLTRANADGEVAVEATADSAAPVFGSMVRLLSGLTAVAAEKV